MYFWESQQSLVIYQWVLRAAITYFWLLFVARMMGQRFIGRLTVFDFVIAISIGSVSAGALSNPQVSLTSILITIGTLALLDIFLAVISLKASKFRRIVQGEPIVLIKNGKLLENTLRKTRINLDDLLMGLRRNKLANLSDVEFAILEPNGKISVIPKSQARSLKPKDLKLKTSYEGLPVIVIEDGNILQDNLKENNLDEIWLNDQLKKLKIDNVNEVFIAMLDTQGKLFVSRKG